MLFFLQPRVKREENAAPRWDFPSLRPIIAENVLKVGAGQNEQLWR